MTAQPEHPPWPAWAITGGPIGDKVEITYLGQPVMDILSVKLNIQPGHIVTATLEIDGFDLDLAFDSPTYGVRLAETDAIRADDAP